MISDDPAVLAPNVVENFADVGEFQRLLSGGIDAVYGVPAAYADMLVALDLGARRAVIMRAPLDKPDATVDAQLQRQLISMRAQLRSSGYTLLAERVARRSVINQIRRNPGQQTRNKGRGGPLVLFDHWIELGEVMGASDLHVEISGSACQVRARVDGLLEPLDDGGHGRYSKQDALDAIAAGYNSSRTGNSDSQYEPDEFVSCMVPFNTAGVSGQLRFQNFKGRRGPKVVIRYLRSERDDAGHGQGMKTLGDAGYAPSHLRAWRQAARAGKGLILIAGVTGSGKTTSQKLFLETLPGLERKAIFTAETPIEYEIRGVHQIEVLADLAGEDETRQRFAEVIHAMLRGDLDGAMVGEVRDQLTGNFLLQIAETGHLGLATLHAHLISSIVPRLCNEGVGLTRHQLLGPTVINLLVYQGLAARVCTACALPAETAVAADEEIAEIIALLRTKFRVPTDKMRFKNPKGCPLCKGRGTRGKEVVAELWQPDRVWRKLVRDGDDDAALLHYRAQSDGDFCSPDMTGKTVFEHALFKAINGVIDVRECLEYDSFERFEILASGKRST